jgi:hypothetical protein
MPQAVQTLIHRVIHTYVYVYVYIYDVYTALLIGKSPNIRSNTVHIYDSGQPYLSTYMLFTSTTCPWGDLCYIYLICQFVSYRDYCHTPLPVTCSYLLVTRSYLPVTHPYLSHAPTCHMPLPVTHSYLPITRPYLSQLLSTCHTPLPVTCPYLSHAPTCHALLPVTRSYLPITRSYLPIIRPYLSRAPTCHALLSTCHTLLSTYHTPLPVTCPYLWERGPNRIQSMRCLVPLSATLVGAEAEHRPHACPAKMMMCVAQNQSRGNVKARLHQTTFRSPQDFRCCTGGQEQSLYVNACPAGRVSSIKVSCDCVQTIA